MRDAASECAVWRVVVLPLATVAITCGTLGAAAAPSNAEQQLTPKLAPQLVIDLKKKNLKKLEEGRAALRAGASTVKASVKADIEFAGSELSARVRARATASVSPSAWSLEIDLKATTASSECEDSC